MTKMLPAPINAEVVEEDELTELRAELDELRDRFDALKNSYENDRLTLLSILQSLRAVFDGGTVDGPAIASSSVKQPPSQAAWQMWKDRLPGACPKVIDALLIQPLTASQLIAAARTSHSSVTRALTVLRNNSLIEKDGDRIRLKKL
jgi:DNA-binding transcriptional ArsR family regulator